MLQSRALAGSRTALHVIDAHTGDIVYSALADEPLNPASNVKLIATATALDVLGPEWRYVTRVLGPAPSADGVVSGDIYVQGNWDPTLGSDDVVGLAENLLTGAGVRRVDGSVHVGLDTTIRRGRSGGGERESVRAPRVLLDVRGAETPGERPEVSISTVGFSARFSEHFSEPFSENFIHQFIELDVSATTVARTRGRNRVNLKIRSEMVHDADGAVRWRISLSGQIPTKRRARYRRRTPDGGVFTGYLLRQTLVEAGVMVTGQVQRTSLVDYMASHSASFLPVELARHESVPLGELVTTINKRSANHLADRLTMTTGAVRYGGPPDMDKGVRAMDEWLQTNQDAADIEQSADLQLDRVRLDTGSGLSYKTRLSARQIAQVLRVANGYALERDERIASSGADAAAGHDQRLEEKRALAAVYRASLAVGGRDGTLRRRFKRSRARRHVIGKTGTLSRVIALSGIVDAGRDNELVFVIISNDHRRKDRHSVRGRHEAMVEAMYRYLRAR